MFSLRMRPFVSLGHVMPINDYSSYVIPPSQLTSVRSQMEEMAQVKNKVQNTYKYLFDATADSQKRQDSANNLMVLAKERAGMAEAGPAGVPGDWCLWP